MVKFLIKNEKLFSVGEIFAIVWKYRMHTNVCTYIRKGATARRVGGGRGRGCVTRKFISTEYMYMFKMRWSPPHSTLHREWQ
jgi:hypothetical protein